MKKSVCFVVLLFCCFVVLMAGTLLLISACPVFSEQRIETLERTYEWEKVSVSHNLSIIIIGGRADTAGDDFEDGPPGGGDDFFNPFPEVGIKNLWNIPQLQIDYMLALAWIQGLLNRVGLNTRNGEGSGNSQINDGSFFIKQPSSPELKSSPENSALFFRRCLKESPSSCVFSLVVFPIFYIDQDGVSVETVSDESNLGLCTICFEDNLPGEDLVKSPDCKHLFHRHCIFKHLVYKGESRTAVSSTSSSAEERPSQCPNCRMDLPGVKICLVEIAARAHLIKLDKLNQEIADFQGGEDAFFLQLPTEQLEYLTVLRQEIKMILHHLSSMKDMDMKLMDQFLEQGLALMGKWGLSFWQKIEPAEGEAAEALVQAQLCMQPVYERVEFVDDDLYYRVEKAYLKVLMLRARLNLQAVKEREESVALLYHGARYLETVTESDCEALHGEARMLRAEVLLTRGGVNLESYEMDTSSAREEVDDDVLGDALNDLDRACGDYGFAFEHGSSGVREKAKPRLINALILRGAEALKSYMDGGRSSEQTLRKALGDFTRAEELVGDSGNQELLQYLAKARYYRGVHGLSGLESSLLCSQYEGSQLYNDFLFAMAHGDESVRGVTAQNPLAIEW